MENFSELLKVRRSMRKFTDEELTQEEVVALMKAALMSPTSKRTNAWQFIMVDDKELLEKLSHCKAQASQFIADAPLAIVVTADPLASDVWIEDASIASIIIQLQAEDMGLGSCWYRCVNVSPLPVCRPMNMCAKCLIFPCNCKYSVSLLSDTKAWNVSLSVKNICNGKKFISINTEESNSERSKSKQ